MPSSNKQKNKKSKPPKRKPVPLKIAIVVYTEAGYRCAVPTCRGIVALDIHHIIQVADGGGNVPDNLVVLCPTCHDLHHRNLIKSESIQIWKSVLVSLTKAFDVFALDQLLFLNKKNVDKLNVSGDGVLGFVRLIAADLASFKLETENGPLCSYSIELTNSGKRLVTAWEKGDRSEVKKIIGG